MKNIKINILAILMTCAALPAWGMDTIANQVPAASAERTVIPFDEPTHGSKARSIFYRAFGFYPPYLKQEDHITKWIPESERRTACVLSLNQNVIGVAAYHDEKNEDGTATRRLDRIAIDEKHRGTQDQHAQFLMQKFEEKTLSEGITNIKLVSYKRSVNFYTNLAYEQTSQLYDMEKTLKPSGEDEKCI